jgi:gluconate 2-dehydrogenase gamma chain
MSKRHSASLFHLQCLLAGKTRHPFAFGENTMKDLSRRAVIKATGAVSVSILPAGLASNQTTAQEPHRVPATAGAGGRQATTYLFFNPEEAAFIEAAVARLIPADDKSPGAIEAGVPNYIDKQLNGAWGAGERLYRSGPWQAGTPSQGYQLPFTPAELYRTALGAINSQLKTKTPFAKMPAAEQDAYLHGLESGGKNLGGVPSNVFFATLWECTVEGFLSDPVYGGNRDMVAWRMIGFPGAYASYYDLVDQHGIKFDQPPTSLAEDVHGHVHANSDIPARLP